MAKRKTAANAAPEFDLTDYLPYLLNRAGARIATAFTWEARRHGLSLQMWRVLAALNQRDGQGVSELADTTSIDISTLSRVLDQMQNKRLVLRRRDVEDQRSITIHRTAAAASVTAKLIPVALVYESKALAGLDARQATALKRILRQLYDNLDALPAGPKAGKSRATPAARLSAKDQSAAKQ
jgi:DNA-binding MarR family transcriptional regulator